MKISDLTLKQKILQMFIVGFGGQFFNLNKHFVDMLETGLGGVIFFTHNIVSEKQFKNLIQNISQRALIPMFYSIDQEGGRVERTEKIHNGKKYLSAKNAFEMGLSYLQNQTKEIALELKGYGINMNFAPVLDVNTNADNPIIGERAFSNNPQEVSTAGRLVIKEYMKYGIIPVGKHFPGHGDASCDSHKTLPTINLSKEDLMQNHIQPFKDAMADELPAIMVAHVLYPELEELNLPSSVSKKIINDILIKQINFNGIIMTDDMEMNGIKGFTRIEACIRAINAGVSMFIFRDATKDISDLIADLEKSVNDGLIKEADIDIAVEKIFNVKRQFGIIQ